VKDRPIIVLLLALALGTTVGCGGNQTVASPTTSPSARVVGPGGPVLRALTAGRQVTAPDGRYALFVPPDWLEVSAGLAELSFQSSDAANLYSISIAREQLVETRQPQVYAEAGRRSVSAVYANVLTLSMTPVQVGEIPAYRWMYTATVSGRERMFYQLFLIDGGEGFVVTGNAPVTSDFSDAQELFDSISGSISFARG
jgi:hypothetical protein